MLSKTVAVEAKLFFREPGVWLLAILLPTFVLVVIGILFAPHRPDPILDGQRFIDLFVPSMVVISLATLGISTMKPPVVRLCSSSYRPPTRRQPVSGSSGTRCSARQRISYSRSSCLQASIQACR